MQKQNNGSLPGQNTPIIRKSGVAAGLHAKGGRMKNDFYAAASVLGVVRQIVGANAYIAGGAARDINLNRKPKDWDIFSDRKFNRMRASMTRVL